MFKKPAIGWNALQSYGTPRVAYTTEEREFQNVMKIFGTTHDSSAMYKGGQEHPGTKFPPNREFSRTNQEQFLI